LVLLIPLAARADDSDTPRFILHRAEGDPLVGSLDKLGEDWSVTLVATRPSRVDGKDVVALRRHQTALPPRPLGEQVLLVNGDQVPGTLVELANERLRFRPAGGIEGEWQLPISALSVLWWGAPVETEDTDLLRRRWLTERRPRDQVLLRNGDVLEGILTALDAKTLRLEVKQKEIALDKTKVAGVALSTELTRVPRPSKTYGHLVLANGCRLALASARCSDGITLTGKTFFESEVKVPLAQVIALDLRQGCAVYLSDLKPLRYEHTSYLGLAWPYVADGNVTGRDLRLQGSTYDKGLGMHSQSRLTYDLAGAYRQFEAVVGLDAQVRAPDGARIQVLVDGKAQELGETGDTLGAAQLRSIRVQVAGARQLTLVVDFGKRGDVQGHVNWADARLIK
jgi:hypothetical protein